MVVVIVAVVVAITPLVTILVVFAVSVTAGDASYDWSATAAAALNVNVRVAIATVMLWSMNGRIVEFAAVGRYWLSARQTASRAQVRRWWHWSIACCGRHACGHPRGAVAALAKPAREWVQQIESAAGRAGVEQRKAV